MGYDRKNDLTPDERKALHLATLRKFVTDKAKQNEFFTLLKTEVQKHLDVTASVAWKLIQELKGEKVIRVYREKPGFAILYKLGQCGK